MVALPDIRTERLRITPFCELFLTDRYIGWLNDPAVTRYSDQRHRRHTVETCRIFATSFDDAPNSFSAIEADRLGHIGNLVVVRDEPNQTADMSILIGEHAAWGQGFGTEAWGQVLRHLLETEGLRKVTAGTMADNKPMLAVMAKTGMRIEGRRSRQLLLDGREIDLVYAAAFSRARHKR